MGGVALERRLGAVPIRVWVRFRDRFRVRVRVSVRAAWGPFPW